MSFFKLRVGAIVVGSLLGIGCGGGSTTIAPSATATPTTRTSRPIPAGPVALGFEENGSQQRFGGPIDFTGTASTQTLTLIASEPGYTGDYLLAISAKCPPSVVQLPTTTGPDGTAQIALADGTPPFAPSVGCTISATDPYGNVSPSIALEYTTVGAVIAGRVHR